MLCGYDIVSVRFLFYINLNQSSEAVFIIQIPAKLKFLTAFKVKIWDVSR